MQVKPLLLWRPDAAAALRGRPDLLAQLLHAQSQDSYPLLRAARCGQADVVQRLLQMDGITHAAGGQQAETSQAAAATATNMSQSRYMQRRVLPSGEDAMCEAEHATLRAAEGGHAAAQAGHVAVVQQLLAHEPFNISPYSQLCSSSCSQDEFLWTGMHASVTLLALSIAAAAGCVPAAAQLLPDLPAKHADWAEITRVLQMAAACDRRQIVQLLLEHFHGAPVDVVEQLLCVPAIRSNAAMVQLLMGGTAHTRAVMRRLQAALQ